jgi:hypothetical protein
LFSIIPLLNSLVTSNQHFHSFHYITSLIALSFQWNRQIISNKSSPTSVSSQNTSEIQPIFGFNSTISVMPVKTMIAKAALLLAVLPAALAGSANVINQCECDVYLWSIANSAGATMQTLASGNSSYSEEYRTNPDGGGISIKLSKLSNQDHISQFEYTMSGETIFYDMSNINGYPFIEEGLILTGSMDVCPSVNCPAGTDCSQAYNLPDDVRTLGCPVEADLTVILCPNGSPQEAAPTATSSAAPVATSTTSSVAAPPASSSAAVFAEGASSAAAPEPTVATWHSVNKRRGHNHGHRFARP